MTDELHSLPIECKFAETSAAGEFTGLASTHALDAQNDVVVPGAFAQTISEHKAAGTHPHLLFRHDRFKPIGRVASMRETEFGLEIVGKFNLGTTLGKECYALAKAGDYNALSIGYQVPPGGAKRAHNGVRMLAKVHLHEVSLVDCPANHGARIQQVKSAPVMISSARELERLLRTGGLSKGAAEKVVALGWAGLKGGTKQDDEEDELQTKNLEKVSRILRQQSLELKGLK